MSARAHVVLVALLTLAGACMAARGLLPSDHPRNHAGPIFALPPAALIGLGLLTFCALLAEGAVGDWSAVYLRDSLGTTPATAATGYAAFSVAMALGRLLGDRLARRVGAVLLLRLSGTVAAGGLAMSLLVGRPATSLLGFGLVGLGLANLIPVLFSAAGRTRSMPSGTALAAVATTGYLGYLAGPPLIGLAAEAAGLPAALAIVCVACGLVAIGARFIPMPRGTVVSPRADEREAITPNVEITHA
jgi:MFS family permease